jgi:chorismate mutase
MRHSERPKGAKRLKGVEESLLRVALLAKMEIPRLAMLARNDVGTQSLVVILDMQVNHVESGLSECARKAIFVYGAPAPPKNSSEKGDSNE